MENSKLFKALNDTNEDEFITLLQDKENEADLKLRDENGRTLFHTAVLKIRSVNVFKSLIEKADISVRDNDGNTAIDLAFEDEDFPDEIEDVFHAYMKKKIRESAKDDLWAFVRRGWILDVMFGDDEANDDDEDDIKEFVGKLPAKLGKVATIHKAVKDGDLEKVKEMLADDNELIQTADRTGFPILHKAVILGETDTVEYLIATYPESLELTDQMDRTALHHAAGRRDGGQYYSLLTEKGAKVDVLDLNGKTPSEIHENPEILPGEITNEKLNILLSKPPVTNKKKKQATQTEAQTEAQTEDNQVTQTEGQEKSEDSTETPSEKTKAPAKKEKEEQKPVKMYISPDVRKNPPPTTVDGKYVADQMGHALTLALAEIAELRPWDPVEYLANWLYKYQENITHNKRQTDLLAQIRDEEAEREREIQMRQKRIEELQKLQEIERQKKQKEEEEKKRKEQEELQRKAKEAALSQQPGLETVMEDKEEDDAPKEKSHKDTNGQTELHKLAAQSAADLTTLLNMGYSPAERDGNNKTARDIAVESKIQENVDAIDQYVHKLVEMEELDTLKDLILAGYDNMDVVLKKIQEQTTKPSEDTQKFLADIPALQEKMVAVFNAVQKEGIEDVTKLLETPKLATTKDTQGRSLLHIAVLVGNKEAVEHLITNFPVSMKCKDNLERTPLHYATAVSTEMVDLLENHGADKIAKDVKEKSPTFYKENPDEIKSMQGSMTTIFTGTQQQEQNNEGTTETTQQETGQQEAQENTETSQQEAQENTETSQQEATPSSDPSEQQQAQ